MPDFRSDAASLGSVRGGSPHTKVSPSLHWVTGKATLTGTWLGCCAGEPLLRGCCETAAGSILLMCVMKRSRSFKAGLRLQIIFSTCFKKRKSEFGKKWECFYIQLLYTNHINTTENGKRYSI